jgi:calmodulin
MASRKSIVKEERVSLDIDEERKGQLREAFDMFDIDKKGTISVDEIYRVMKNFGNEMTKAEIKEMIADLDQDNSGELDFEEFVTFIKRTETTEDVDEDEEVIKAFKTFDRDNNGYLSLDEFRHILTNLGDRFSDAEVDEIFKEADIDGDHKLEYVEFVNYWKNK